MSYRLASVLVLAACSSAAPHKVDRPPPAMPATMVAADFAALVAHNVLTAIELPVISRAEDLMVYDDAPPAHPGEIQLSNAAPGGWSQSVYADGAHRLWVVTRANELHVPDGVIISATHIWNTTVSIPAGYVLGGTIQIVGNPDQLPSARAPIG